MVDNMFMNATGSGTATTGSGGASGAATAATGFAQAASVVASTISNIVDQTKRRQFEQALAMLNQRQMNDLNQKMLAANTQTERIKILDDMVVTYGIALGTQKSRSDTTLLIVASVMAVVLLGIVVFYVKTKKK